MSTLTQTGSMTKRFSLSVNKRITDGLLSSSGTVAVIGLISATLTLLFVIWFVLELQQQSRVGAPLARSAAVLNASINQSLSALRGWVAYGQPHSRTERGRIWSEQIEPTLARLAHLMTVASAQQPRWNHRWDNESYKV
ncbi:MAG: hypothetical protein ABGY96_03255 [bacterium]|nr:hypothetical protein [Gammaproteobacteria bacterium]